MAVISVNLTDTFEQWRTKTNSLATQQGDLTTLTTTAQNTMVAAINEIDAASTEVLTDTTPQLGGNLDVLARIITTSTTNGNIAITPHGSGKVVIDGISHPNADGTNGQVLQTNGSGVLSFATISSDPTMGGDLSGTASNAQLVANAITDAEVADNALSGNKIDGGTISNFASTGIDDNATSNAITIDSSGGVIVKSSGTTTPTYDFSTLGEGLYLRYWDQSGGRHADLVAIGNTPAGATQDMRFFTNSGGGSGTAYERMRINSSGNVGIGATSPNDKLEISSGGIRLTRPNGITWNGTNEKIYVSDGTDGTAGSIICKTGGAVRMHINAGSGNVGIGTTSPTQRFHVSSPNQVVSVFEGTGVSDPQIYLTDNSALVNDNTFIIGYDKADNRGYLTVAGDQDTVFTVANGGNIGIGTASPSDKLYVSGNIYATGNITAYSDERLKTNINELNNTLSAIQNIRGVSYTRSDTKDNSIGVMAQDVETMFPELISEDYSGMKGVNYNGLVGVLFSAVKELSNEVKQLKKRVN